MTNLERVSVEAAARRLGVGASTVRRRIAAGHLPSERELLPRGSRVWVYLPEPGEGQCETPRSSAPHVITVEPRIQLLEHLLLNEQQAGAELRQLLGREQAAHQAALAALASLRDAVSLSRETLNASPVPHGRLTTLRKPRRRNSTTTRCPG